MARRGRLAEGPAAPPRRRRAGHPGRRLPDPSALLRAGVRSEPTGRGRAIQGDEFVSGRFPRVARSGGSESSGGVAALFGAERSASSLVDGRRDSECDPTWTPFGEGSRSSVVGMADPVAGRGSARQPVSPTLRWPVLRGSSTCARSRTGPSAADGRRASGRRSWTSRSVTTGETSPRPTSPAGSGSGRRPVDPNRPRRVLECPGDLVLAFSPRGRGWPRGGGQALLRLCGTSRRPPPLNPSLPPGE